jgi:hypothetical protein
LAFPIRVEMNRTANEPAASPRRYVGHMVLYGVGLLVVSLLMARVVPASAMSVVGNIFGEEPGRAAPILILMVINIHHYFTDGVIWKISNPEVRRELFAHVATAKPLSPSVSGSEATVAAPRAGKGAKRAKVRR